MVAQCGPGRRGGGGAKEKGWIVSGVMPIFFKNFSAFIGRSEIPPPPV